MSKPPGQQSPIALVSMPWAIFNRPSIQLGALKSYIESQTECQITTLHPFLQIAKALGTGTYAKIADNSWAGESLFAALLFPEHQNHAEKNFRECLGKTTKNIREFTQLVQTIETVCDEWLASIEWQSFLLTGFSLCFNQLLGSLYIASRIKALPDSPKIAFGGSSCSGELGISLLKHFSQIDYIVDGEGEIPLTGLCLYLQGETTLFPERVHTRTRPTGESPLQEISDLNTLPTPDFTPYFEQLKIVFPDAPFIPVLPIEFSRGCWWNKCTFCNLNLQWCRYRWKNALTMTEELQTLIGRHQCLDFTFTDNALPPREADSFFTALAEKHADIHFFAEIRTVMHQKALTTYHNGGLETIQVGIEALSETLLKKMQKGVSVIDNVAMLKHAAQAGIQLEGNLIVEFPGTTREETVETLECLEYLWPFKPLASATFFLGHGSPVDKSPRDYGILAVTQHRRNRRLFPHLPSLTLLAKEYRGDRQLQRKLWQPVRKKIAAWQRFHEQRTSHHASTIKLS